MNTNQGLVPLLIVQNATRAIDFYVNVLGAQVLSRYEHGPERRISHADLTLADAAFALTEEARAWNSDAPPSLGGSPVVLQLSVADASAALTSMTGAGATVVFPLQELFGECMARVRDPFGHLWILRQRLEELSVDEMKRRRDALFAQYAPQATAPAEEGKTLSEPTASRQGPRIHLVIGPVGAGKSTFALALAHDQKAVRLTLDEWMSRLFSPDRPDAGVMEWYVERSARCIEQIWTIARGLVDAGTNVILEIGLLSRRERDAFYRRVAEASLELTIHVLDASRELRKKRVEARNVARGGTFSMVVPPAIFELASDLWEPLDSSECADRDVRFIRTDSAGSE